MRPATPLLCKTPFAIDPRPVKGATTARAGLAAVSRVFRSLKLPGVIAANVPVKVRRRGFEAAQYVESLALVHVAGGDCVEDMDRLGEDAGLSKIVGYELPSARAVGEFLDRFHDGQCIEEARAQAQRQRRLAFIPEENEPLQGLRRVHAAAVRAISRTVGAADSATVDQDATIIESHKQSAQPTYDGRRGYQPMVAVWAEMGLILADEFRDGNVPADMAPRACAQAAFGALPAEVTKYYFRGDSACHEHHLIEWLRDEQRVGGPQGFIGIAISARMSKDLAAAVRAIPARDWTTINTEPDGTHRQWAEVDFVPGERTESKDLQPLRYLALRLLKPQGLLFADGTDRQHFAVLTNRVEGGAFILNWHRLKAGTVEHTHEELKNGLGGGRMPSNKFGANAAWFRIACLTLNLVEAIRRCWPEEELRTAKLKKLRFALFAVTGRVVRDRRKFSLRLCASKEWIAHFIHLFDRFPLTTRATG
jgi:hypothetical protein